MLKGKVLIAQGGGPTAVINQSLVGAVMADSSMHRAIIARSVVSLDRLIPIPPPAVF